ncbi:MAG: bifunctional lysylphosphatidylglycerol flippase/synthetase MprF [Xanthomonadaceae bacterium]|jgi:phosphatidylglycerol lysyltransferase|nr:bifunctional lysylphosphatidylglycerol flippase/synthetase MprF [Xanthomonadaceae bacterium]
MNAAQVAQVVATASLGFALGAWLWLGLALAFEPSRAALALRLPAAPLQAIGLLLLAALAAAFALGRRWPPQLALRGHAIALPRARDALLLLVASALELSCAALALYALLPAEAAIDFLPFVGIYLLAITAGLVSTVPGGLGVFEAALIALLPQVPAHSLLGAIVVYRGLYYLLPLLLALGLLGARELAAHTGALRAAAGALRRIGEPLAAPLAALAVSAVGACLLVSGSLPVGEARLATLSARVPLPLLELSHLGASLLGVGLLLLARGLQARLDAAWLLAVAGLGAAIPALLLYGLRWELALAAAAVLVPLAAARRRFDRPTPLGAGLFAWPVLRNVVLALAASVWLGLFAYRHVEYADELWWRFAFDSDAPRMLRASLAATLLLAAFALWGLLRPLARPPSVAGADERERAAPIAAASGRCDAQLALLPDKQLLFDPRGEAFVMFQRSGPCLVAMGDPVGAPDAVRGVAWAFRERADREGLWPVFYQVSAAQLPTYLDLGLSLLKLGEEAVVPLAGFSLDGSARAELRQAHRRAQREGATFGIVPRAEVPALLPELAAVSAQWLAARGAAEKGFSLGYWDPDYMARFDCAVVRAHGRVVAFANLWPGAPGGEVSIDLMRHADDAPRGSMDFLFVELMLWARAAGWRDFVLGMAPLSGLSRHQLAPAWHKIGGLIWRHGEAFYHFEGLRRYKEKFQPQWRPRYLASPGGMRLPRVLLEVARLIAAGPRGEGRGPEVE